MKKFLFFLLLCASYLTGCDSDNPSTPQNSSENIETTINGSTLYELQGYTDAAQGYNTLKPEGLTDPMYLIDKKLTGKAYTFIESNELRLDKMQEVPSEEGRWTSSVIIAANKCYWIRHTSTLLYTYLKLRVTYINGNNVGIEYIIDSTEEHEGSDNNINANSPIEGKSFVTDYSMPHLNPANYYVEHTVNYNNQDILNYAYEWIDSKKHTAWVAFSFDNTTSQQKFNRPDEEPWSTDPNLPEGMSPQESNHKNDGFDKGHICASADRLYDITANAQTFYYSNMSPQMTSFNGGYWITLEGLIQKWARSGEFEKMYVTKGGTMNELLVNFTGTQAAGDSKIPTTDANGFTKNGLACPKYYFIAVLAEKSGQYQSIGFLVEHRDDYGYSNSKQAPVSVVKQHSISIDELEQKTELDFFCNLPDIIENQVESSFNETDWNF